MSDGLHLNPHLKFSLITHSPVPGAHVEDRQFLMHKNGDNLAELLDILIEKGLLKALLYLQRHPEQGHVLEPEQVAFLRQLNILLPREQIAQLPEYLPQCSADALKAFQAERPTRCILHNTAEPPPELSVDLPMAEGLSPRRPLYWVAHPRYAIWQPLYPSEQLRQKHLPPLESATDSASDLEQLDPFPPDQEAEAFTTHNDLAAWQEDWQRRGYVILPELLSAPQRQSFPPYIQALEAQGFFSDQDMVPHRKVIYDQPVLKFWHGQLCRLLRRWISPRLVPSYSMLGLYHSESEMQRHVDRSRCVVNVTLVLASEPAEAAAHWPLILEPTPGQDVPVALKPGDAVVYSGTQLLHRRPPLPRGQRVAVGLFHFIET